MHAPGQVHGEHPEHAAGPRAQLGEVDELVTVVDVEAPEAPEAQRGGRAVTSDRLSERRCPGHDDAAAHRGPIGLGGAGQLGQLLQRSQALAPGGDDGDVGELGRRRVTPAGDGLHHEGPQLERREAHVLAALDDIGTHRARGIGTPPGGQRAEHAGGRGADAVPAVLAVGDRPGHQVVAAGDHPVGGAAQPGQEGDLQGHRGPLELVGGLGVGVAGEEAGDEQPELGGHGDGRRRVSAVPRLLQRRGGAGDVAGEQLDQTAGEDVGPAGGADTTEGGDRIADERLAQCGHPRQRRVARTIDERREQQALAAGDGHRHGAQRERLDPAVGGDRLLQPSVGALAAGFGEQQPRVGVDHLRRQARQPRPGLVGDLGAARAEQPRRTDPVLAAAAGPQRLGDVTVLLEDGGRPPVALAHGVEPLRLDELGVEVGTQDLVRAERVVALQRRRHELQPLQLGQRAAAPAGAGELVAQRRRQQLERRRLEEEPVQLGGQAGEHVVGEEVPVGAAPPAHLRDGGAPLGRRQPVGGQVEELEGGDPPTGPALQLGDLVGEQRPLVLVAEQPLDLPGAEPQVVGADQLDAPPEAQPGRVERRPVSRQRHQVGRRRQVVDHRRDGPLAAGADDGVELVDDDQQPAVAGVVAADQHAGDVGAGDRAPRRPGDGFAEVGGEHRLVAVDGVGAVPHAVAATAPHEVAGRGRLAGAGRPDDHRQRDLPGAVEEAVDAVPRDRRDGRRFEAGPRKRTDSHRREAD